MKYSVKHGLDDHSKVRVVVEQAYVSYEQRLSDYQPSMEWTADDRATIGFLVMSQTITAEIGFDKEELRIDGKVPLLFLPFRKKIQAVLGREMEKWLDKARKGEI